MSSRLRASRRTCSAVSSARSIGLNRVRLPRTKQPGTSVPGQDRTTLCLSRPFVAARLRSEEFIVQAGEGDVVGYVQRARHRRYSGRERGTKRRVDGDPVCLRQRSQIDEEVFKLRRPATAKPGLCTGANSPSRPGGGKARAARQKWTGLQRAGKNHRVGEAIECVVILDGGPGEATGHIPQCIADERARARACRAKARQLFLGCRTPAETIRPGAEEGNTGRWRATG